MYSSTKVEYSSGSKRMDAQFRIYGSKIGFYMRRHRYILSFWNPRCLSFLHIVKTKGEKYQSRRRYDFFFADWKSAGLACINFIYRELDVHII